MDILRPGGSRAKLSAVSEELIARSEIVGLLFNVSDISVSLSEIERLLRGDDEEEEEADGS